jgi:2,3-bisphosphoglycerate-independent phosphoglycerate mutase
LKGKKISSSRWQSRGSIRPGRKNAMDEKLFRDLSKKAETKILLLVLDGLGGLQNKPGGLTELETARTPHMDRLAEEGFCGLHRPIGAGITPGSGPAHLALFGYDPLEFQVGRGVLAALGIDFDLREGDVACRGNFCTLDDEGRIKDRRAGRISSEKNRELCGRLRDIKLPGVEIFIETVKEHRFLLVLRGEKLAGEIADTDPQELGLEPLTPEPLRMEAARTAALVSEFLILARKKLAGQIPANMVLLRGFSQMPRWPSMEEIFGIRTAAVAAYPMYRGVAKLVGMTVLDTGEAIEDEIRTVEKSWKDYDFFYVHIKAPDSAGEDGDFDRKVSLIEQVDSYIPRLRALEPDVLIVTGDHSTPSVLKAHSWHPVPVVLWSESCRADPVSEFGERACMGGGLGMNFPAVDLMPLALAHAFRFEKFGA